MNENDARLTDLLRAIAGGEATVARARELETLIATKYGGDPRLEDLELALATFSPTGGPGLIRQDGLMKVCRATLQELG